MNNPNLQKTLEDEADRQVSSIESNIGRELKLEELREDVKRSAAITTPPEATAPQSVPQPAAKELENTSGDTAGRKWTRDQKIAIGVGIVLGLIALVTLIVMLLDQKKPETRHNSVDSSPTGASVNQGPGSIAQIGGAGNQATVNNYAPAARRLLEPDKSNFIECLKTRPGKFSIGAIANNAEAYTFAQDWRDVFIKAGWKIEHKDTPIQIFLIGGVMWSGVHVNVHDSSTIKGKPDLLNGSPEKLFFDCGVNLNSPPITMIPFKDVPTGVVRVQISERP
jgi:hypothetical protein